MLLNKRKRNPGQNLTKNWALVNNVCEPATKSLLKPPEAAPISWFWVPNGFNELRKMFFEFPSNPTGKLVIVQAFLTGQPWQVNKSHGTQLEHNKHSALSHRPRGH